MSKYELILDPKRCFTSVSDIGPGPKKKIQFNLQRCNRSLFISRGSPRGGPRFGQQMSGTPSLDPQLFIEVILTGCPLAPFIPGFPEDPGYPLKHKKL